MTLRNIFSDGQRIKSIDLNLQKDKIKIFKKYSKQKKLVGHAYGAQIFLDAKKTSLTVDKLSKRVFFDFLDATREKFKRLEDHATYVLELTGLGKKIICRTSEL